MDGPTETWSDQNGNTFENQKDSKITPNLKQRGKIIAALSSESLQIPDTTRVYIDVPLEKRNQIIADLRNGKFTEAELNELLESIHLPPILTEEEKMTLSRNKTEKGESPYSNIVKQIRGVEAPGESATRLHLEPEKIIERFPTPLALEAFLKEKKLDEEKAFSEMKMKISMDPQLSPQEKSKRLIMAGLNQDSQRRRQEDPEYQKKYQEMMQILYKKDGNIINNSNYYRKRQIAKML
ncbi:MAG: hypothetical protein A3J67_00025 [Parcubacteria group bacterium RIFCSPHIGHO2_02_FULL_48_10b]|nr:MAG: hypothetical protein A3J67_00025 [Parcubacteria group bacterium RIFCSPHIGHO2_02_FULL_48_10b]